MSYQQSNITKKTTGWAGILGAMVPVIFSLRALFGFWCTTKILAKLINNSSCMATVNFLFLHCTKHCVHQSTHTLTPRGNLGSPIKRTGLFLDCWKKPRTSGNERNQTQNLLSVWLDWYDQRFHHVCNVDQQRWKWKTENGPTLKSAHVQLLSRDIRKWEQRSGAQACGPE